MNEENRGFNLALVAASKIIQVETEQLIYSWESFVAEVGEPSGSSLDSPSMDAGLESARLPSLLEIIL